MTATDSASTTAANTRALPDTRPGPFGDRRRRMTNSLPMVSLCAQLTTAEADALRDDMVLLDEPFQATAAAPLGTGDTQTFGARVGQQLVGAASVSRQQPPGPPMRGFYRIHGVAVPSPVRGHGYETGLIEHCTKYAAANGGRTLWARVPLDTVDVWRQAGFAIAGPPLASKSATGSKTVWALMMRRLAPTDAGLG